MARATLASLIAQLRLLVADTDSPPAFSDDDLETFLDANRREHRYEDLTERESIAPGGAVTYLEYRSRYRWWEDDEELVTGSYVVLAPASADRMTGTWVLAASQNPPVLITGKSYDLNAAAADVLEAWAAKYARAYDFKADDQSFSRSQIVRQLREQAAAFRARQGIRRAHLTRSDQPAC